VSVFVCMSVFLSPEPQNDLNLLCMLPIAVARSSGGVTQYQGEGAILGCSSPLTMQCMGHIVV